MKIRYQISVLLVLLLASSSCGFLNRQFPSLGLPESKMSTTATATTTGAVVGAGLGAVIGSTTGNAGEGVAIGAASGGAVGALVGSELQGQEESIAEQKEIIARQGVQIETQNREILGLRDGSADVAPENLSLKDRIRMEMSKERSFSAKPLSSGKSVISVGGNKINVSQIPVYRGTRQDFAAQRFDGASVAKKASSYGSATAKKTSEIITARQNEITNRVNEEKARVAAEKAKVIESAKQKEVELIESVEKEKVAVVSKATTEVEKAAETINAPEKIVLKKTSPSQIAETSNSKSYEDGSCVSAADEAKRAERSTSDADKLFYYRRAIRLCPNNPVYHVGAGTVYASIGRVEDAKFSFNKALALDPDNEVANEQLQILAAGE